MCALRGPQGSDARELSLQQSALPVSAGGAHAHAGSAVDGVLPFSTSLQLAKHLVDLLQAAGTGRPCVLRPMASNFPAVDGVLVHWPAGVGQAAFLNCTMSNGHTLDLEHLDVHMRAVVQQWCQRMRAHEDAALVSQLAALLPSAYTDASLSPVALDQLALGLREVFGDAMACAVAPRVRPCLQSFADQRASRRAAKHATGATSRVLSGPDGKKVKAGPTLDTHGGAQAQTVGVPSPLAVPEPLRRALLDMATVVTDRLRITAHGRVLFWWLVPADLAELPSWRSAKAIVGAPLLQWTVTESTLVVDHATERRTAEKLSVLPTEFDALTAKVIAEAPTKLPAIYDERDPSDWSRVVKSWPITRVLPFGMP